VQEAQQGADTDCRERSESAARPASTLGVDAALFRAMIEHSQDIVTVCDADGVVQFESPSVRVRLGWAPEELIGRSVFEFVHPDDAAHTAEAVREALETGAPREALFRFRHHDGHWRTLEAIGQGIDHQGTRLLVVNSRDVTDLRATLREVDSARQLFEKVFSSSRNLKSVSDLATGRLVDVNDAWLRSLRFERDEVIGRTAPELGLWGEDSSERARIIEKLEREGFLRDEETTLYTRDGEARTVRIDAERIVVDGEPRVLFSGADITDARRTEEQLRQSQKMEALGQLTGGVAHDFNNLLGVIMGNGELLQDHLEDDEEALEYIEPLLRASERGAALTQQLLAFARRQALAPEAVHVGDQATRMRPMLQTSVPENVSVRIEARSDLWTCRVDPGQLENAILNLVLNARDAMPAGGAILIHASNRRVTVDDVCAGTDAEPGDYVALTVSDTGTGIDSETLARVFEPFFTTKAPGQGTGLGLSMVFGFVNQTGGAVQVESWPGEGTSVTLLLPRATGDEAVSEPDDVSSESPTSRGETVLILEDNDALRALLTRQLVRLGYEVIEARDEHALQQILRGGRAFDLVVSDVMLTGTRLGPELARAILHHRPGTAVLFISGYPSWARDLAAEAHVLNKPFRMDDFARAVRKALDRDGDG
jgi:PAS domain S-box-containing protein